MPFFLIPVIFLFECRKDHKKIPLPAAPPAGGHDSVKIRQKNRNKQVSGKYFIFDTENFLKNRDHEKNIRHFILCAADHRMQQQQQQ
jgi:hypothetical protein